MNPDEMAVRLAEVDQRSKSNTHRLDTMEGQISAVNKLATSVELLVQENKHQTEALKEVKDDVQSLSSKVETIEQKPAKKWEGMVEKIAWALIAAVLGFALAHLGLG